MVLSFVLNSWHESWLRLRILRIIEALSILMFKLILDHEYTKPKPAVDSSRFMQHGTVVNTVHNPNGRQPASGALRFTVPSSEVRVPSGPAWANLGGMAVQVWLKLDALSGQRRNIIEGDNCFALFVDSGGAVVASFLGLVQGQITPQWNIVSTALHSPTGNAVTCPVGVWTFVSFIFDGIGRARIWIDGVLAGVRTDFVSGVGSVGPAGVVIGNWTLCNQYWLMGEIDSVRVWKEDPVAPIAQLYSRLKDEAQRKAWDRFFDCLAQANPDRLRQYAGLAGELDRLLRVEVQGLYNAPEEQRDEFFALLGAYRQAWQDNTIQTSDHTETVLALYRLMESFSDQSLAADLHRLIEVMEMLFNDEVSDCFDRSRLAKADPEFWSFIDQTSRRIG
jgi:hypothetical protein